MMRSLDRTRKAGFLPDLAVGENTNQLQGDLPLKIISYTGYLSPIDDSCELFRGTLVPESRTLCV